MTTGQADIVLAEYGRAVLHGANDVEAREIREDRSPASGLHAAAPAEVRRERRRPVLLRLPLAQFGDVEAGECQRRRHCFPLVCERSARLLLSPAISSRRFSLKRSRSALDSGSSERTASTTAPKEPGGRSPPSLRRRSTCCRKRGANLFENGLVPDAMSSARSGRRDSAGAGRSRPGRRGGQEPGA